MLRRLLVPLVAIALFASACGQESSIDTAIVEPTRDIATTTAIPLPTATLVPTATPEPSATVVPTVTPAPVATPTQVPTPAPTSAPAEVPTPEPAPAPVADPAEGSDEPVETDGTAPDDSTSEDDSGEAVEGAPEQSESEVVDPGAGSLTADVSTALPKPEGQGVLPAAYALSSVRAVGCPSGAQSDSVLCYFARVPAAADSPSAGSMIDVLVSVIDNGDPSGVGPVVYLQGGPGVASVEYASRYVGLDHDVVLIDQRGNGSSVPKLGCDEVNDLWVAERTNDPAVRLTDVAGTITLVDAFAACAARLQANGVDLNLFDTTNAANDFALIRQLLGYPEWSIWGVSYGTRLGLTLMRDHPEGIKAAVLDSVVPFEVDFFATIPANGLRSMTAVSQACNASACGSAHGDFLANLGALARQLDDEPRVITVTRPASGQQFEYRVNGKELLAMVFTQLYSTERLRALPRQIARADFGGIEEILATYVQRRDPEVLDLALGSYYATWCSEEYPFYDHTIDDGLLLEAASTFGPGFALALSSDGVANVCSKFNVRSASSIDDRPFSSAIPTLVMAGSFDPITPPSWSKQVADALTNSYFVELADHGHGMTGSCTAGIRLQFLREPNAAPDTSCAAAIGAPAFE